MVEIILYCIIAVMGYAISHMRVKNRDLSRRLKDYEGLIENRDNRIEMLCQRTDEHRQRAMCLEVVLGYLDEHKQLREIEGATFYSWQMVSPYPTLAEAVKHVSEAR